MVLRAIGGPRERASPAAPLLPLHIPPMPSLVPLGAAATALLLSLASLPLAAADVAWSAPEGWTRLPTAVHAAQEVRFLVGLKLRNVDALERAFWQAAEPDSPQYGSFWSKAQVDELTGPSKDASSAVRGWLSTFATTVRGTEAGDWFEVRAPVAAVARALDIEFSNFRHNEEGTEVLRAHGHPVAPAHVDVIDVIHGLSEFVDPRAAPGGAKAHGRRTSRTAPRAAPRLSHLVQPATPVPAPFVSLVMTTDQGFVLSVDPMCPHAQYGCNVTQLPLLVEALEVRLDPVSSSAAGGSGRALSARFPINETECYPYYTQGGPVQCTLVVRHADTFQPYNITVSTHFKSGAVSDAGVSPAIVYASPWALPETIRALYNASDIVATHPNASVGVALFEYQYCSPNDSATFYGLAQAKQARAPVVVAPTDPNDPRYPGDEGQMDIELAATVGAGAHPTFWYASDNATGLLDWAMQVNNASAPPLVFSVSWGLPESKIASMLGPHFEARLNAELMKMGLRGVTVAFASGDAGATSIGRGIRTCDRLEPSFPASSPYVVSVSATMLRGAAAGSAGSRPAWPTSTAPICDQELDGAPVTCAGTRGHVREVAVSCCGANDGAAWTTGGGFSNHYARPAFQRDAVAAYLKDPVVKGNLPPAGIWNATGRAYPDVSAIGQNLLLYIGAQLNDNGGTSASTPIVAGLLALVNDARLSAGKPPLGPAAPWLYKQWSRSPTAFNDVVVGNNACGEMACCPHGFSAHTGWDPVTGLGSLNLGLLREAAQAA